MAALSTVPVPNDLTPSVSDAARRHIQFDVTTNAATSSTWATGIESITNVAWTPSSSGNACAVTFSGGTITFTNDGAGVSRTVHIWC